MPLNVRRFYTSVLLVLVSFILVSQAQTVTPPVNAPPQTPTSGVVVADGDKGFCLGNTLTHHIA